MEGNWQASRCIITKSIFFPRTVVISSIKAVYGKAMNEFDVDGEMQSSNGMVRWNGIRQAISLCWELEMSPIDVLDVGLIFGWK